MVGVARESNKTYIRNINSTGLNGAAVTVDVNTGLLGHATSSRHYKEEIQPMDQASESLADKLRVLRTSVLFWETFVGASSRKKASGVPPNIEAVAAVQRRREIKARGLKEANWAVRFFFIDNTYRRVLVRKCFLLQVRQRCRDSSGLATLSVNWTMPRTAD